MVCVLGDQRAWTVLGDQMIGLCLRWTKGLGLCLRGTKGHGMYLRGTIRHGMCLGGTKGMVCLSGTFPSVHLSEFARTFCFV